MNSFDWKNIEDSIINELIITAAAKGVVYVIKTLKLKPTPATEPQRWLVLYTLGSWWKIMHSTRNWSTSDRLACSLAWKII